jgi:hypothetical protein
MIKKSQVTLYFLEYLKTQNGRNIIPVLTVGNLRRISGQCGHHSAGLCGSDVCHLVIKKQQSVGLEQWH